MTEHAPPSAPKMTRAQFLGSLDAARGGDLLSDDGASDAMRAALTSVAVSAPGTERMLAEMAARRLYQSEQRA